jgi:hypothetical protein
MPAAIAAQNRRCSSRPATTGRPGENNSARPDRSERRLCFHIATPPFKVLRRPFESSQYVSIHYTERLAEAGIDPSVGSVGDSYDNALAETVNGLFKTEVIRRRGPWRSLEAVDSLSSNGSTGSTIAAFSSQSAMCRQLKLNSDTMPNCRR